MVCCGCCHEMGVLFGGEAVAAILCGIVVEVVLLFCVTERERSGREVVQEREDCC